MVKYKNIGGYRVPLSIIESNDYWSATNIAYSTADTWSELLPTGPRFGIGAWRCIYCRMINDSKDKNCAHCSAPGEI